MSIETRLGIAGIVLGGVMALVGIAITILWPDKRWIGWICLASALALLGVWLIYEVKQWLGVGWLSFGLAVFIGALVGGVAGGVVWFRMQSPLQPMKEKAEVEAPRADPRQEAERARIKLDDDFVVNGLEDIANGSAQDIQLRYSMNNYGKTEGQVVERTFKVLITDKFFLPLVPSFAEPISSTAGVEPMEPNVPFRSEPFPVPLSREPADLQNTRLTKEEAKEVLEPAKRPGDFNPGCKKYLFVYGYLKFTDVFDKKTVHTRGFAYLYYFKMDETGKSVPVRYKVDGPTKKYWVDE